MIALVIVLAGLLIAGCASQASSPAASTEPTLAGSQQNPEATEEPTLPPIPTRAVGRLPTSMVLIEKPGESTKTAAPPAATVDCKAPAALTPSATEGPYFKAGSPETTDLMQSGMPGTKLELTGYVLTAECQPVANALVDFWQADSSGAYDNTGFTLRGHQYTDENGRYQLVTVVPGLYTGRTEHIHVKVQAPNGPMLTTQLFFPDVQSNASDSIFNADLVISVQETADGEQAEFNFIVVP